MRMTKRLHMSPPAAVAEKPKRQHASWVAFGLFVLGAVLMGDGGQPLAQLSIRFAQEWRETFDHTPRLLP
jgi:hypothetical protein